MTTKNHPTEATHAQEAPVTQATAHALLARLGVTEVEAQALLALSPATEAELAAALRVNLHALAAAFDEATTHALHTDPKLDLGDLGAELDTRAARVRTLAGAADKLHALLDDTEGAAALDAASLQEVLNAVAPQLRARGRLSAAVRQTYSSLLAYQHSRYPGHRGQPAPAAPAKTA